MKKTGHEPEQAKYAQYKKSTLSEHLTNYKQQKTKNMNTTTTTTEKQNLIDQFGQTFLRSIRYSSTIDLISQVKKIDENRFSKSITLAENISFANEFFVSKECKNELKNKGKEKMTKDEFFKLFFGISKGHYNELLAMYKAIKNDDTILQKYKEEKNIGQSIKGFLAYVKGEKMPEMNTTKETITERTETEKPKKITTEQKHIEAKIHKGATKDEMIQFIKNVMEQYKIDKNEL